MNATVTQATGPDVGPDWMRTDLAWPFKGQYWLVEEIAWPRALVLKPSQISFCE